MADEVEKPVVTDEERRTRKMVLEAARKSSGQRQVVPSPSPRHLMFLCAVMELNEKQGREETYGLKIAQWFEKQLKRPVNAGQIYAIGGELVEDGYVKEETIPNPKKRGRSIIVYELTPLGEIAFDGIGKVLEAGYKRKRAKKPAKG